jgi:cytoskeletal protein RodZ
MRPVRRAGPVSLVTEPQNPPGSPELHFGTLLRRARERRGLSQQDVVRVTRISDRWIPALEEARLDLLPAPVFVSGYVRSYARAVGLDERDMLDRYHALVQHREEQARAAREELCAARRPPELRRNRLLLLGCSAAVLLLVIVGLFLALR